MNFENDADWDTMQLENQGRITNRLAKKGICLHGWNNTCTLECYHCKKVWESIDAMNEEIRNLRADYL